MSSLDTLTGYFDASYADDPSDRHSTCGYAFFILGGPISWGSKKQSVLALSSTEAEFMAATEAAKESQWITTFLREIGFPLRQTILYGDNKRANALILNPMYHSRTKHIDIRYRYIAELTDSGVIKITHCRSKDMIADILTKPLPRESFQHLRSQLTVASSNTSSSDNSPLSSSRKRGGTSSPPFICTKCQSAFSSRNALFSHLQSSNHFADNDIISVSASQVTPSSQPVAT